MKGYTFCCGGIYFYFGGGAFIYEGVYFLLWRDILLLEGGAFLEG